MLFKKSILPPFTCAFQFFLTGCLTCFSFSLSFALVLFSSQLEALLVMVALEPHQRVPPQYRLFVKWLTHWKSEKDLHEVLNPVQEEWKKAYCLSEGFVHLALVNGTIKPYEGNA